MPSERAALPLGACPWVPLQLPTQGPGLDAAAGALLPPQGRAGRRDRRLHPRAGVHGRGGAVPHEGVRDGAARAGGVAAQLLHARGGPHCDPGRRGPGGRCGAHCIAADAVLQAPCRRGVQRLAVRGVQRDVRHHCAEAGDRAPRVGEAAAGPGDDAWGAAGVGRGAEPVAGPVRGPDALRVPTGPGARVPPLFRPAPRRRAFLPAPAASQRRGTCCDGRPLPATAARCRRSVPPPSPTACWTTPVPTRSACARRWSGWVARRSRYCPSSSSS